MATSTLQVKFSADIEGFLGQMRKVDEQFKAATKEVNGHGLALGKVTRALETLAAHVTGTNHQLATITGTLGEFAAGSLLVTGVTIGIAAIGFAYEKLTEKTRKAREEQEKLVQAFLQMTIPKTGPGSPSDESYKAALQRRADLTRQLMTLENGKEHPGLLAAMGFGPNASGEVIDAAIANTKAQIDELNKHFSDLFNNRNHDITTLPTVTVSARNMGEVAAKAFRDFVTGAQSALTIWDDLQKIGQRNKTADDQVAAAYDRVIHKLATLGSNASQARAELLTLLDALMKNDAVIQHMAALGAAGTVGPLVGKTLPGPTVAKNGAIDDAVNKVLNGPMRLITGVFPFDVLTKQQKEQIAQDKKLNDELRQTVSNTAAAMAQVVAGALLHIGGSTGQRIGGGLGGTIGGGVGSYYGAMAAKAIGGAVGSAVGSVIPVFGTVVGAAIGSAIGGLFGHHHHKTGKGTPLDDLFAGLGFSSTHDASMAALKKLRDQEQAYLQRSNLSLDDRIKHEATLNEILKALNGTVSQLNESLQNMPTGFKNFAALRYAATAATYGAGSPEGRLPQQGAVVVHGDLHVHGVTDLKQFQSQVRTRATRGGAPLLVSA